MRGPRATGARSRWRAASRRPIAPSSTPRRIARRCAPRSRRAHVFGITRLLANRCAIRELLVLLLSQGLAQPLRIAQGFMDVLVGRSILEEQHALTTRTLPGISTPDPTGLVSELRRALRAT